MAGSFHHRAQRSSQESFTWHPATSCSISPIPPTTFCIFMFCAALLISGNFRKSTLLCCVMHLQSGHVGGRFYRIFSKLDSEKVFKVFKHTSVFVALFGKKKKAGAGVTVDSFFFIFSIYEQWCPFFHINCCFPQNARHKPIKQATNAGQ